MARCPPPYYLTSSLTLDLLIELEEQGLGFSIGRNRLSSLAYADDILALADSSEDLQQQVHHITTYLHSVGLQLSVSKFMTMHLKRKGKSWIMPEAEILSGDDTLQNLRVNDNFRYLGATFNAVRGLDNSDGINKISEVAARCTKLKLKPTQKLDMLCKFILPSMYHLLFTDLPSGNTLNGLDQTIKRTVKEIFHLPASTSDGLIFGRIRDGGLGAQS